MLPRWSPSKLVSTWLMVTLVASVIAVLDGGWLARWAAFAPSRIWHGELWRLVTWFAIERGPIDLFLTTASIYKFGGELAVRWGDRRLRRFVIEILAGAMLVTLVLALASESVWQIHRLGGWAVRDVLAIAWARQFPGAPLVLYGLVRLNGRNLVLVIVAITGVFALYAGPLAMTLELAACAAAVWYPSARLARQG